MQMLAEGVHQAPLSEVLFPQRRMGLDGTGPAASGIETGTWYKLQLGDRTVTNLCHGMIPMPNTTGHRPPLQELVQNTVGIPSRRMFKWSLSPLVAANSASQRGGSSMSSKESRKVP